MNQVEFTEKDKDILLGVPLFEDLSDNKKLDAIDKLDYSLYEIKKNDIIARQNTLCKTLFILLEGELQVDIIDGWGNKVKIEEIIAPRVFATPHLFTKDSTLPATFTVTKDGILFKATKESVFKLISEEPTLLKNFLCVTGNCNKCTVTRLHALQQKSVRNRFIVYLLQKQKKGQENVHIEHNQVQLAEYLCVTRPALSKEINKMEKENLILVEGKKVRILDVSALEKIVS